MKQITRQIRSATLICSLMAMFMGTAYAQVSVRELVVDGLTNNEGCEGVLVGITVDIDDPNGEVAKVELDFGDGTVSSSPSSTNPWKFSRTYNPGTWRPSVRVFDAGDNLLTSFFSDEDLFIFHNPVAGFSLVNQDGVIDLEQCLQGNEFCMNDTSMEGPEGHRIVNWDIDWGDGTVSTDPRACKTYEIGDRFYDVILTVEDEKGCVNTVTKVDYAYVWKSLGVAFAVNSQPSCPITKATFINNTTLPIDEVEMWIWDWGIAAQNGFIRRDTFVRGDVIENPDGTKSLVEDVWWTNFDRWYSEDGLHSPRLIVKSDFGCWEEAVRPNSVKNTNYPMEITWTPDTPCYAEEREITFSHPIRRDATQVLWNFGDPNSGPPNVIRGADLFTASHEFVEGPGWYNIYLQISEPGCVRDTTISWVKFKGPSAAIGIPGASNNCVPHEEIPKSHFERLRFDGCYRKQQGERAALMVPTVTPIGEGDNGYVVDVNGCFDNRVDDDDWRTRGGKQRLRMDYIIATPDAEPKTDSQYVYCNAKVIDSAMNWEFRDPLLANGLRSVLPMLYVVQDLVRDRDGRTFQKKFWMRTDLGAFPTPQQLWDMEADQDTFWLYVYPGEKTPFDVLKEEDGEWLEKDSVALVRDPVIRGDGSIANNKSMEGFRIIFKFGGFLNPDGTRDGEEYVWEDFGFPIKHYSGGTYKETTFTDNLGVTRTKIYTPDTIYDPFVWNVNRLIDTLGSNPEVVNPGGRWRYFSIFDDRLAVGDSLGANADMRTFIAFDSVYDPLLDKNVPRNSMLIPVPDSLYIDAFVTEVATGQLVKLPDFPLTPPYLRTHIVTYAGSKKADSGKVFMYRVESAPIRYQKYVGERKPPGIPSAGIYTPPMYINKVPYAENYTRRCVENPYTLHDSDLYIKNCSGPNIVTFPNNTSKYRTFFDRKDGSIKRLSKGEKPLGLNAAVDNSTLGPFTATMTYEDQTSIDPADWSWRNMTGSDIGFDPPRLYDSTWVGGKWIRNVPPIPTPFGPIFQSYISVPGIKKVVDSCAQMPHFPYATDSIVYLWDFSADPSADPNCTSTVAAPNIRCAFSTEVTPTHMFLEEGCWQVFLRARDLRSGNSSGGNCESVARVDIVMEAADAGPELKDQITNYETQQDESNFPNGERKGMQVIGAECANSGATAVRHRIDISETLPSCNRQDFWVIMDGDTDCDTIECRKSGLGQLIKAKINNSGLTYNDGVYPVVFKNSRAHPDSADYDPEARDAQGLATIRFGTLVGVRFTDRGKLFPTDSRPKMEWADNADPGKGDCRLSVVGVETEDTVFLECNWVPRATVENMWGYNYPGYADVGCKTVGLILKTGDCLDTFIYKDYKYITDATAGLVSSRPIDRNVLGEILWSHNTIDANGFDTVRVNDTLRKVTSGISFKWRAERFWRNDEPKTDAYCDQMDSVKRFGYAIARISKGRDRWKEQLEVLRDTSLSLLDGVVELENLSIVQHASWRFATAGDNVPVGTRIPVSGVDNSDGQRTTDLYWAHENPALCDPTADPQHFVLPGPVVGGLDTTDRFYLREPHPDSFTLKDIVVIDPCTGDELSRVTNGDTTYTYFKDTARFAEYDAADSLINLRDSITFSTCSPGRYALSTEARTVKRKWDKENSRLVRTTCFGARSYFFWVGNIGEFWADDTMLCDIDTVSFRDSVFYWRERAYCIPTGIHPWGVGPSQCMDEDSFFYKGFDSDKRLRWQGDPDYTLPQYREAIAWDFNADPDIPYCERVFIPDSMERFEEDKSIPRPKFSYEEIGGRPGQYTVVLWSRDSLGSWVPFVRKNYITIVKPRANFALEFKEQRNNYCAPSLISFQDSTELLEGLPVNRITNGIYDSVVEWKWLTGDGRQPIINKQDPKHTYLKNGEFDVTMEIVTAQGCKDTIKKPLYITVEGPQPGFEIVGDDEGCAPFEVIIRDFSKTVISNGVPRVPKLWEFDKGDSTLEVFTELPENREFRLTYEKPGRYPLRVTTTDTLFNPVSNTFLPCTDVYPRGEEVDDPYDTIWVTVLPVDTVHQVLSVRSICPNDPIDFADSSNVYGPNQDMAVNGTNYDEFNWRVFKLDSINGDTLIDSTINNTSGITSIEFEDVGKYEIKYSPLGAECPDETTDTIEVREIIADIEIDYKKSNQNLGYYHFRNKSINGVFFEYEFFEKKDGQLIPLAEGPSPQWKGGLEDLDTTREYRDFPLGEFVVKLIAYDQPEEIKDRGCVSEDTVELLIEPDMRIFNTITPNGDGVNDKFEIALMADTEFELLIYNRWGANVYTAATGDGINCRTERSVGEGTANSEANPRVTEEGIYRICEYWDGTDESNGEAVEPGTYFYIFKYTLKGREEKVVEGTITIVR